MRNALIMVVCFTIFGATVGAVAAGFGTSIAQTQAPLHEAQL